MYFDSRDRPTDRPTDRCIHTCTSSGCFGRGGAGRRRGWAADGKRAPVRAFRPFVRAVPHPAPLCMCALRSSTFSFFFFFSFSFFFSSLFPFSFFFTFPFFLLFERCISAARCNAAVPSVQRSLAFSSLSLFSLLFLSLSLSLFFSLSRFRTLRYPTIYLSAAMGRLVLISLRRSPAPDRYLDR